MFHRHGVIQLVSRLKKRMKFYCGSPAISMKLPSTTDRKKNLKNSSLLRYNERRINWRAPIRDYGGIQVITTRTWISLVRLSEMWPETFESYLSRDFSPARRYIDAREGRLYSHIPCLNVNDRAFHTRMRCGVCRSFYSLESLREAKINSRRFFTRHAISSSSPSAALKRPDEHGRRRPHVRIDERMWLAFWLSQ